MRSKVREWQGVVLIAVAIVATLGFAWSGQLDLYIDPAATVFAVVMSLIGLVLVIAACAKRMFGAHHDHDDHPDVDNEVDRSPSRRRAGLVLTGTGGVLATALAIGFIVLPPATLTSATASQRVINATAVDAASTSSEIIDATGAAAAVFDTFTVFDWASVLRQTSDVAFYADKPANLLGFVTPDAEDPENMFYVSRFVITHCAIDAQPVGVPVYSPGWADGLDADEWVQVSGDFASNSSRSSTQPIVLEPADIEKVGQPDDPYLY